MYLWRRGEGGFDPVRQLSGLGACVVPANVLVRHLICTPPDLAEVSRVVRRRMSAADVRSAITTAVEKAVRLLLDAAKPLTRPRPKPGPGDMLRQNFLDAFGVQPEFVPSWRPAGQKWDRGAVVRERLRCAARILSNGSIRYHCWGPISCRDFVDPWVPEHIARVRSGELRICLGEEFWRSFRDGEADNLATAMLHEALHIYFGTIGDTRERGPFGFANCYDRYVLLMNGLPLSPWALDPSCASGLPKGDFPLPPRDRAFAGGDFLSSPDRVQQRSLIMKFRPRLGDFLAEVKRAVGRWTIFRSDSGQHVERLVRAHLDRLKDMHRDMINRGLKNGDLVNIDTGFEYKGEKGSERVVAITIDPWWLKGFR